MKIKGATEAEINTVLKILAPYFTEYDFYFYGSMDFINQIFWKNTVVSKTALHPHIDNFYFGKFCIIVSFIQNKKRIWIFSLIIAFNIGGGTAKD